MTLSIEETQTATLVRLHRPPVNALDLVLVEELERVFNGIDVGRPAVLTGSGETFSAGFDTKAFVSYPADQKRKMVLAVTRLCSAMLKFPKPLIAAVNGHAMGVGVVLFLCADYRVAVANGAHQFGLTEAKAGVPFPVGPTEILHHEVPAPLLRSLALSGRIVDAQALLEAGVFDELVTGDELFDIADKRARGLVEQPAFETVKAQVRGALATRLEQQADAGTDPYLGAFE